MVRYLKVINNKVYIVENNKKIKEVKQVKEVKNLFFLCDPLPLARNENMSYNLIVPQ